MNSRISIAPWMTSARAFLPRASPAPHARRRLRHFGQIASSVE